MRKKFAATGSRVLSALTRRSLRLSPSSPFWFRRYDLRVGRFHFRARPRWHRSGRSFQVLGPEPSSPSRAARFACRGPCFSGSGNRNREWVILDFGLGHDASDFEAKAEEACDCWVSSLSAFTGRSRVFTRQISVSPCHRYRILSHKRSIIYWI